MPIPNVIYSTSEIQLYTDEFNHLKPVLARIPGPPTAARLAETGLPRTTLRKIWNECDEDKRGSLTMSQFFWACRLCAAAQHGLPSVGPVPPVAFDGRGEAEAIEKKVEAAVTLFASSEDDLLESQDVPTEVAGRLSSSVQAALNAAEARGYERGIRKAVEAVEELLATLRPNESTHISPADGLLDGLLSRISSTVEPVRPSHPPPVATPRITTHSESAAVTVPATPLPVQSGTNPASPQPAPLPTVPSSVPPTRSASASGSLSALLGVDVGEFGRRHR